MSRVGRNDPCPCGSGKKFKRCHGSGLPAPSANALPVTSETVPALLEQAMAWQRAGRWTDAERAYRTVLETFPDHALALEYLGVLALQTGNAQTASLFLQRAVERNSARAEAHFNQGGALLALGEFAQAARCFERALAINPRLAEAHQNLGNIHKYFGRIDTAIGCYRRAVELQPENSALHSNLLTSLHYSDALSHERYLDEHLHWAERHARRFYPRTPHFANLPDPERPLRIGFVSPNFSAVIVGHFLSGLFTALDRAQCALYCYSSTPALDAMGETLRSQAQVWRDVSGQSDDAVAALIESDKIDILVDLAGHVPNNRLLVFARKPAPIQITWLDYFDTSGLATMDYVITDPVTTPGDSRQRFTERLLYLPETRLCYTPPEDAPEPAMPPERRNGQVIFGSYNRLDKMNETVIATWAAILRRLPEAKLIVKNAALSVPEFVHHTQERFTSHGVGPEQLELRGASLHRELLAQYAEIDLALDTFPYNGGATTFDALWMGVPVITVAGERMIGRQTTALLACLGLNDFVAGSRDEFVELAVAKAFERDRRRELRLDLRTRMQASALCDAVRFTRAMEDNFRLVWRRWCAEQASSKESVHATN